MFVFKHPWDTCKRLKRTHTGGSKIISNILPSREKCHAYSSYECVVISYCLLVENDEFWIMSFENA